MNSTDERIARMHERAKEMKKQRDKKLLRIEGAITGALGVCMLGVILMLEMTPGIPGREAQSEAGYAGALMPDVADGGHILFAVVIFMFVTSLAVFMLTYGKIHKKDTEDTSVRGGEK